MAWTTPDTWTAGQVVTAADFNEQIRDNMLFLYAATRDFVYIVERQTAGTAAGTFTSGAWQTRLLNVEVVDISSLASLSSNQVTLEAGTWIVRASAPAYQVDQHKVRLYNVTDAAVIEEGTVQSAGSGVGSDNRSFVTACFTLASAKTVRLEHRCASTKSTDGFGNDSSFGTHDIYAVFEAWRIATA